MKKEVAQCTDYFRGHPAFHRMLERILQKYRTYGYPAGKVFLADATEAECEAAQDFFGKPFSVPLQFQLKAFEIALQQTKFQNVTLRMLLEDYFYTTIQTKKELRSQMEWSISQMLTRVGGQIHSKTCQDWLSSLSPQNSVGQLLRKEKREDAAESALLQACYSMAWLESHPNETVRLAVLSARATSNPHTLDSNVLSGKLFLYLLAFKQRRSFPSTAEERDLLYYDGGVLCDSIASTVTQVGLVLSDESGEHLAFQAFRQRHESSTLTLMNLSALTSASSPSGRVYLVENQMVFSQLCDQAVQFHSPLLCTSGQPQVAVLRLLDLLEDSGTQLFYSGDFDGEGLAIAARLMTRFPHCLHPWHMETEDYFQVISDFVLTDNRLQPLRNLTNLWLISTATAILEQKRAGYQELLIPALLADLMTTL